MSESEVWREIKAIKRRLDNLRIPSGGEQVYTDNVSNPPTDAELDAAIGSPADLGGRCYLMDDAGAGTTVWRVCAVNSGWWYEQLTKAT